MMKRTLAVVLGFAVLGLSTIEAKASQAQTQEKEWTLMVFLNGDNNLDSYGTADMKEMEMVGSSDQVNIVVLRDTSKSNVSSKVYYVEKGQSRVVKDYGSNIDMGDWKNLVEFFRYARENYPAKKYFVDIWNHGGGWRKKSEEADPTRGISYDDHSGNYITTPQLGEAFRQMQQINGGQKVDILGMDACVMQMAEVSWEVKDSLSVVVASEDNEPGDGWAYQTFLAELAKNPAMDGNELGITVAREYARSYDGGVQGRKTVQGSAVSTEKLAPAMESVNAFLSQAIALAPMYHRQFTTAINQVQQFGEATFKDLRHYLAILRKSVNDPGLQALIDTAEAKLNEAVLGNFVTGSGLNNAKGISIWIPDAVYLRAKKEEYSQLSWARDNLWDEFLESILIPNFPLVSVGALSIKDTDGDGFLKPGEAFSVQVELKNESDASAQNVRISLAGPAEVATVLDPVTVPAVPKGSTVVTGPAATLNAAVTPGTYAFRVFAEISGVGTLESDLPVLVDKNYTVEDFAISTAHPYPSNLRQEWTITRPGAAGIRIHFARFDFEKRFDTVQILDKDGNILVTMDGARDDFWTQLIPGDTARVRVQTDGSVNLYGFDIDRIAY